jgi:two-component system, sensor histidine kinase and response regulator
MRGSSGLSILRIARVFASMQQAVQTGQESSIKYRIVLPDGTGRRLASRGHFQQNSAQGPNRLMGVTVDITDRKQAEQQILHYQEPVLEKIGT